MLHDARWKFWVIGAPAIVTVSAIATALLIVVLRPTLARYALARPNARSSHRIPTPQGAGIAIIAVVIVVSVAMWLIVPALARGSSLAYVLVATAGLAIVGAADDIITLRALPRLGCQLLAASAAIASFPDTLRVLPWIPLVIERAVLVLALVWFINLVNFMDGIDWITVAEVVPVCVGITAIALTGAVPPIAGVLALSLGGATIGFAPFNRPIAKLFLGDVGSLPIGLVIGWLLIVVAMAGHLAAAVLLPLYYLVDATLTLLRRLARGERVWEAHRTHYYQRATDRGLSVQEIVAKVFVVNLLLVGLALATVVVPSTAVSIGAVILGALLVAGLLLVFTRGKS